MKTEMNLEVLKAIFGQEVMNIDFLTQMIKKNSSYLISELESYRILDEEETEVIDAIENIYKKLSRLIIDRLSEIHFNMPIEAAIATKKQDEIKSLFLNIAEKMGFDNGLQEIIDSDLDKIANELNKRFTFDEASLIHLIEASKASNIQLEEEFERWSPKDKRQILRQKKDGTYYLAEVTEAKGLDTYTSGRRIPTITYVRDDGKGMTKTTTDESHNIILSSYPGAEDILWSQSTYEIMKQVMKNLFDNLELCVDTYKFFYTKNPNAPIEKSNSVMNKVVLEDDSEFDFYYEINRNNLPHLLGIQKGEILSETTKRYFSRVRADGSVYYPINENSSAFAILKAILDNKERIIADGGLVEENGKLYQLFPWEKIILKTSSLIRGDFFKTCFCLVQLDHGINSENEKYVSIFPTRYNDNVVDSSFDVRMILRDLINIRKQKKDFIFRTFVENYYKNDKGIYVPNSIYTGKSESIVTNNGERIETLNRFRKALQGNEGSIVKSIENEKGKRIFSPIEKELCNLAISSALNGGYQASSGAYKELEELLNKELNFGLKEIFAQGPSKRR